MPSPDVSQPIAISAPAAMVWRQGQYDVFVFDNGCQITQGATTAKAKNAVIWIDKKQPGDDHPDEVIAYLEDEVAAEQNNLIGTDYSKADGDPQPPPTRLTDSAYLMRLSSAAGLNVRIANVSGAPSEMPAIYARGMARRDPSSQAAIRRTQYLQPLGQNGGEPAMGRPLPGGMRRIRINSRSSVQFQTEWVPEANLVIITDGVNVVVDGLEAPLGTIDVSADRVVIWTDDWQGQTQQGQHLQASDQRLELYMEGNIVFRQGQRTIYANRMYYDVRNRVGIVLDAEILTPVPEYQGLLRLQTDVLQQTGEGRFFAQNSFITTSRMGKPSYRVQMSDVHFDDIERPMIDPFTGQAAVNPETCQPVIEHQRMATGNNTFIFIEDVPVFYWPYMATDLEDPTYYIRSIRYKNDRIFGNQILTTWDVYQLLGVRNKPTGTKWEMNLDWLSKRGFGVGTDFSYQRDGFLMIPGPTAGLVDAWGIHDTGYDVLGRGRNHVEPETDNRYRILWKHRQLLGEDYLFTAEVGKISDRDFLEQYFQNEWNNLKDQNTGLELKHRRDNTSWSITADYRLNDFFTSTNWLPRADHFWLGQPLLNDVFTWFEHSQIGYGQFERLTAPTTSEDRAVFSYMPWEIDSQSGERLVTRQELDWPIQMGPVKTVPYALGEFAHWGKDIYGEDMQRFYWQAGLRASMPMWKVNSNVENTLWNVHGIAHKVVFDADLYFAQANQDMDDLPLYDAIDDDSVEAFRRMMMYHTFGFPSLDPSDPIPIALIPPQFDARSYALRSGMAGWVTATSTEIADDMTALRMNMRHRWQTKRGMPGRRHITDWIVFDAGATWFPDKNRDNFGEDFGLANYDFRWHVGDRLTLLSDGLFDFFDDGQKLIDIGGNLTRPPRGSLYMGFRILQGPIENKVLLLAYTYQMSPKWVSTFSTSFDLGNQGNLGQNFTITRVGESMLIRFGFNVNPSTDDVGVMFALEPRFLSKGLIGGAGGARIPPAGLYGLE